MLLTAASGHQAALMAPTEILAEQHFKNICRLLGQADGEGTICFLPDVTIGLLTGGIGAQGKTRFTPPHP